MRVERTYVLKRWDRPTRHTIREMTASLGEHERPLTTPPCRNILVFFTLALNLLSSGPGGLQSPRCFEHMSRNLPPQDVFLVIPEP